MSDRVTNSRHSSAGATKSGIVEIEKTKQRTGCSFLYANGSIPSRCAPDACHPVFFRIQVHDTVPWFPVLEISDLNIFWYFGQR
jgi:hypothetical protein